MIESNLKAVACGGGRPDGKPSEALKHAVELTGVRKPRVLIDTSPKTSAETALRGFHIASNLFESELGLETNLLRAYGVEPSTEELRDSIQSADLIYISGGDTDQLMRTWQRLKIADFLTAQALAGQIVISGISAGAITPFCWGLSDSLSYRTTGPAEYWDYMAVNGLGIVPAAVTPHNNSSSDMHGARSQRFINMFMDSHEKNPVDHGFGLDNFAAVTINDGYIYQTPTDSNAQVHYTHYSDGKPTTNVLHMHDRLSLQ